MINNEDKTMYCKYCSEYYYVTNHEDIIEHETSINHLMNISEKNHRSAIIIGGDVGTIFKKHTKNATKNIVFSPEHLPLGHPPALCTSCAADFSAAAGTG